MNFENEEYNDYDNELFDYLNDGQELDGINMDDDSFEDFDDTIMDLDFSEIEGKSFKKEFSKVNKRIERKQASKGIVKGKPGIASKRTTVKRVVDKAIGKPRFTSSQRSIKDIPVRQRGLIKGPQKKKIAKVLIPRDRKVIVEGVSKFILSQDKAAESIRQIGYYKGDKLKELVLIFNNNSAIPFTIEIFNPSSPLDYLYSTSQNLNNKIQVSGGVVQYSDVLFNILGNPTMVPNCKFTFAGPLLSQQISQPLEFKNKNIEGTEVINPLNVALTIDTMQVANDIVFFDMQEQLNRPFIPNGMDIIKYTVLPGMTVNMAFFYKQVDMKKVFYAEARESRSIL